MVLDDTGSFSSTSMNAMDDLTATALRAAQGDRAALSTFVRSTQADVWRLSAHLVDRDAADDLAQDVFTRALSALPSFRADAPARTWLLSITYRTCADHLRRRDRRRRLQDRLAAQPPNSTPAPDATGDAVATLALLDDDERAAMVLTQLLGLRYRDAAHVLGVPLGTIRSRVARARRRLVDALDEGPAASEAP